ncbi:MAG: hypothetical protein ACRCW2_09520 [Cellulosilyticaceae bacterium]
MCFTKLPEAQQMVASVQLEGVLELAAHQAQLDSEMDEETRYQAWQEENKRRSMTLAAGKRIYGCEQYTFAQYKAYVESNRAILGNFKRSTKILKVEHTS